MAQHRRLLTKCQSAVLSQKCLFWNNINIQALFCLLNEGFCGVGIPPPQAGSGCKRLEETCPWMQHKNIPTIRFFFSSFSTKRMKIKTANKTRKAWKPTDKTRLPLIRKNVFFLQKQTLPAQIATICFLSRMWQLHYVIMGEHKGDLGADDGLQNN